MSARLIVRQPGRFCVQAKGILRWAEPQGADLAGLAHPLMRRALASLGHKLTCGHKGPISTAPRSPPARERCSRGWLLAFHSCNAGSAGRRPHSLASDLLRLVAVPGKPENRHRGFRGKGDNGRWADSRAALLIEVDRVLSPDCHPCGPEGNGSANHVERVHY